ncbi:aminopeptidase Q [Xenopus laevis]|uniref:Aminopeptidase n=2 Tax=Xenopus laevis TaxID=8355 RepID=A0A1L8HR12_XENLA|nr:aminopeptidase Q [Xenopus laevis]OCT98525.1 hypothetical protein XELAEV_18010761mg [Xenopus laevis]
MGPKSSSGFYLSRTSATFLSLLLAALILVIIILGALYARTTPPQWSHHICDTSTSLENITDPTGRPGVWNNPRLPQNLVPLHYDLELWPRMQADDEGNYLFSGQVNITISCVEVTDIVLLHSVQLNFSYVGLRLLGNKSEMDQNMESHGTHYKLYAIDKSTLQESKAYKHLQDPTYDIPGGNISTKSVWTFENHSYVVLELSEELVAGNLYLLELNYTGFMRQNSALFITHYKDFNEDKAVVASFLEPENARAVYPCFDEPALKATFKIRLVHNSSYVALSNMPAVAVSEREDKDGSVWTVTTFNTTPKMSTYITAFVICDFDYVNITERGNEIRIWARKEFVQKGFTNLALSIAGPLLAYMEDLFNVSYPLQKTDFVALPDLDVEAMENWGLITFIEEALIYDPKKKLRNSKFRTSLIFSHEIAHQWFGNLVTMKWWTDLWLNEGFASYMEYFGVTFLDSKLNRDELFTMHNLQPIFESDVGAHSNSVSLKKDLYEVDSSYMFNEFTYDKGSALVRMLSSFLTEKLFIKGISSYLKTFSFSNVDQDDLWNHLQMFIDQQDEVQLPTTLRHIMQSWTFQRGIPLLTLNTTTGKVAKEMFKTDNTDNITSDSNHSWIVPVTWMKNGIEQTSLWLDSKSKVFPLMTTAADEWIVLNINVTGYYRTNYNKENWNRLAKQLETNPKAITTVNRIQLIEDAFTLARYGYNEYGTALHLTKYLEKEDEINVWYTVLKHVMSSDYPLVTYTNFPLFKKYILKRINPIYQRYANIIRTNFDEAEDDYFIQAHIELILKTACSFGLQDCLQLAHELYATWMKNCSWDVIPESIRDPICCYAIANGGENEWEFAWEMVNKTEDMEIDFLFYAMSCSKEPWLLHRYLQYSLDMDKFSAFTLFHDIIKHEIGRHIAWEFLKENWQRIKDIFGPRATVDFYNVLLPIFASKATSDLQFQEIQLFINTTMNENQRERVLELVENKRRKCLGWTSKINDEILNWLQSNIDEAQI